MGAQSDDSSLSPAVQIQAEIAVLALTQAGQANPDGSKTYTESNGTKLTRDTANLEEATRGKVTTEGTDGVKTTRDLSRQLVDIEWPDRSSVEISQSGMFTRKPDGTEATVNFTSGEFTLRNKNGYAVEHRDGSIDFTPKGSGQAIHYAAPEGGAQAHSQELEALKARAEGVMKDILSGAPAVKITSELDDLKSATDAAASKSGEKAGDASRAQAGGQPDTTLAGTGGISSDRIQQEIDKLKSIPPDQPTEKVKALGLDSLGVDTTSPDFAAGVQKAIAGMDMSTVQKLFQKGNASPALPDSNSMDAEPSQGQGTQSPRAPVMQGEGYIPWGGLPPAPKSSSKTPGPP